MSDLQELLTRGVEEVIDREHLGLVLASGKKLRVKLGIDPTSPHIHIGRAGALWKLRDFQDLGHQVVFIVGDFTGLIADTSDKESERPMMTEKQISENIKTYFAQAAKIIDPDKAEMHYNSEWLKKLGAGEISKLADLFGMHEFEARENISRRLKAGKRVSLRELLYPLFQGFDSVAVKANIELGGTDQKFNLLAGRVIQKAYGQEPQDIITRTLMEGTDGRKMSSSWGNVINIIDEPGDMFGKAMSIGDEFIIKYFKLATRVPLIEIEELQKELSTGSNPKDIKAKLAFELVKLYHGDKVAQKAQDEFEKVFSEGKDPEEIKGVENKDNITQTIVASGVVISSSEVKRLIDQKAVKVNGQVVDDWRYKLKKGDTVKIGSRKFIKIE